MMQVLVVDDDLGTLDTFGAILRAAGHFPSLAATGYEGLAVACSIRPDLILADLRLPDISGLELLARVRNRISHVPVVIVTAFSAREIELAARQLGAVAFVEKPIDEKRLLEIVSQHALPDKSAESEADIDKWCEVDHAATHWAAVIMPVLRLQHDVPTIGVWARELGYSQTAIKKRCTNVGVRASDSRDFARALRIVVRYRGRTCKWLSVLEIIDSRTLTRFLKRATFVPTGAIPDIETYLNSQAFIAEPSLVGMIRRSHR